MADQLLAIPCYASPCCLRRGSAIGRPPYVSRQTVAAVRPDGEIYGSISATVVFINAAKTWTRLGAVLGGPI